MKMKQENQAVQKAKGRPMLQWVGKKPLEKIEYFPAQEKEFYGEKDSKEFNKLFWGDNLQVLAHLLKDYRGEVDLIYIDPPFDSKADYVKKVKIFDEKIEGEKESLLEEKQYTDMWNNDEYLQFIYERLLILRELLSNKGSLYLHCDWTKGASLKMVLDEIFDETNFLNGIAWKYTKFAGKNNGYASNHDLIFYYSRSEKFTFNQIRIPVKKTRKQTARVWDPKLKQAVQKRDEEGRLVYYDQADKGVDDVWTDIQLVNPMADERTDYPTQKPEALLERIIKVSSNPGDLILDCFSGGGTTMAVAQKLGRRWIGCDINLGAIQTTVKRLNQIIDEQAKKKGMLDDFKGLSAFKVYNVNEYDIFKNEMEAKEIIMEIYGIEPIKRGYFDGMLDRNFVKILSVNRVFNKLDIRNLLKHIENNLEAFTVKKQSKTGEPVYEEGVIIICSGLEMDALDYLRKENSTGVKIEIRDIQRDKSGLIFKQKPEARVRVKVRDKKLNVEIVSFHSPILMQKLARENEKRFQKADKTKIENFLQIIDSVAIDVDYDSKLFNAEIIDVPSKKELARGSYEWTYSKSGKNTVAIKIVDILAEEYFETFEVTV